MVEDSTPIKEAPKAAPLWKTLCQVMKVTPNIPGTLTDYDFEINLSQDSVKGTTPNEVTVYWPYRHYGSNLSNFLCYSGITELNCSFMEEGILNIRFNQNIPVGPTRIPIKIVGVPHPIIGASEEIILPCTVNSTVFATNTRTAIIIGSGSVGPRPTTLSQNRQGRLRFLNLPAIFNPLRNPRATSVHRFRISIDTATPINFDTSNPIVHIWFPTEYKLSWYTNKPTAIIEEYTSASNVTTKTSVITPSSIVTSGNRVTLTINSTTTEFTTTWRYWDIVLSNIINPPEPTDKTTSPYKIVLTNAKDTVLYSTYDNHNTFASDIIKSDVVGLLNWNKGYAFSFNTSSWVVDFNTDKAPLNQIYVRAGRYTTAYMSLKSNTSNETRASVTNVSLNDTIFKTSETSYSLATSFKEPLKFFIGCTCVTPRGYYVANFSLSNSINFAPLSPVMVTVENMTPASISFTPNHSTHLAGTVWVGIFISESNFDDLAVNWTKNDANHVTAQLSNVTVPATSIVMDSTTPVVYSIFSIANTLPTQDSQKYSTVDPNGCFSFSNARNIAITIDGTTAIIPVDSLTPAQFRYDNSNTDPTITNRNSIKFLFNPPAAPVFLYCALACFSADFPVDADIIAPKLKNSQYIQFHRNLIPIKAASNFMFHNLIRGQQYKMRCIIQSTQTNITDRTQSNATITKPILISSTNSTSADIIPSPPSTTTCAQWNFLSEPGSDPKEKILNYCQRIFSENGYFSNGCIVCTTPDASTVLPGLSLPVNITCPTGAIKQRLRLRFLQDNTFSNVTLDSPTTYAVCPISHPVCETDVGNSKSYNDIFTVMVNTLSSNDLFNTTLLINNIRLSNTTPVTTYNDNIVPDLSKLVITITDKQKTGTVRFNSTAVSPIVCHYSISTDPSTTLPTLEAARACTTARCGKVTLGPVQTTVNTGSTAAPFTPGTYNMFVVCTNNIPFAQKSTSKFVGSFTIEADPIIINPNNTNNTNTTSSGFLNLSILALLMMFAILLN